MRLPLADFRGCREGDVAAATLRPTASRGSSRRDGTRKSSHCHSTRWPRRTLPAGMNLKIRELVERLARCIEMSRRVVRKQRGTIASIVRWAGAASRKNCVVVNRIVAIPHQHRGSALRNAGERVFDEGKYRHPEILAWISRIPDRAVGTAGGAAVIMQGEVIQFRHDCGLGHQCRKVVIDALRDGCRIGPCETKVADPVRDRAWPPQFAHDSRMLRGVHPDALDAVPVGFIVRCKEPELELPVVAGVVRDRSDRLHPLVFH